MNFKVRPSQLDDLEELFDLSKQFGLLNLPADRNRLLNKLEISQASFRGELPKAESEYVFVLEDCEAKKVIGSSLIIAKHGTPDVPHNAFKVFKKNHYSEDLGIGFIHQVLQLKLDTDGPTEIGGLLIDKNYRSRPEKLGRLMSLSRFLYMRKFPDRFENRIHCELTPPLTEEGRSEFWEALGRRFTGLPYQEADLFSQTHKEFIGSLFPTNEIYLALLDTKARAVLGRVGEETKPAQHLLESLGFDYLEEVDPFDGGPHYGCLREEVKVIKNALDLKVTQFSSPNFKDIYLVSSYIDDEFTCVRCHADVREDQIMLAPGFQKILNVTDNEFVQVSPFNQKNKT